MSVIKAKQFKQSPSIENIQKVYHAVEQVIKWQQLQAIKIDNVRKRKE